MVASTSYRKRPRSQRTPLAALLRPPVLLLTYAIAIPLLWLLERVGAVPILLGLVGRVVQRPGFWLRCWEGYEPDERDVIVGCYFKSGTNWTMQIAQQIIWRGRGEFEHIHDVVAWPDAVKKGYALDLRDPAPQQQSPTGLRVIKTHAPFREIPYSPRAKYVLVVRDPKDVFVSSYHFIRDVVLGPLMPSVTSWFEAYLSPHFFTGNWADHAAGYWAVRERDNVLFLSFKELKQDLRAGVERIAGFLEVDLDADEIERICSRSSFEYMQGVDAKFAPGMLTPWSSGGALVRSGRQGGSGELLSREQQQRIDTAFQRRVRELDSDLDYESITTPPS